jgi:hypothetical protein
MSAAQGHCNDLEASQLGMVPNINNKKARGLMRAGGKQVNISIQTGRMIMCLLVVIMNGCFIRTLI